MVSLSRAAIYSAIFPPDVRKSLKPKLASSAAAMEAMVCDLEMQCGHDRGGIRIRLNGGVCASLAAQAGRCGHGFASREIESRRYDCESKAGGGEAGVGGGELQHSG